MSNNKNFDKLFSDFAEIKSKTDFICQDFCQFIKRLGFVIRKGKGGHKVLSHPSLSDKCNFNCGHSPRDIVKRGYLIDIYNFVDAHKVKIKKYVNGAKNDI